MLIIIKFIKYYNINKSFNELISINILRPNLYIKDVSKKDGGRYDKALII